MKTNKPTFANSISARSQNGLSCCFGRDRLNNPEIIAEAGKARLALARNLGKKSLRETAEALYRFGYIDDVKQWFES